MPDVVPDLRTGERYASAVGALWSDLSGTLARLERLAAGPDSFWDGGAADELRRLQYRLHSAAEGALGLTPPRVRADEHNELAAALEAAREATGELAETLELDGPEAAAGRLYEWRGALFRVRLARRRLTAAEDAPIPPAGEREQAAFAAPLAALGLTFTGATLFLAGAATGQWPLWACGALVLCSSLLAYRP
jgi:hypothetical protein